MCTVFCDLNFIVTAHQETDAYKRHLQRLSRTGTTTFVLSPMHWVEAAEDGNLARGSAKADFMDELQARWIYERRCVQKKEVAAVFFRFLGIHAKPPQMLAGVADVIADLAGVRAERNSRDFVAYLRGLGQEHPLAGSLQQAFEANRVNGDRFRSGQLDANFLRRMEKLNIGTLLPQQTPAGVVIPNDSKTEFLECSQLNDFPAVAIESLATYDAWRENRCGAMAEAWIKRVPMAASRLADVLSLYLHRGEAETIALAADLKAEIVIVDGAGGPQGRRGHGTSGDRSLRNSATCQTSRRDPCIEARD
jgi:predicted nucleic acid-binding protein